MIVPTQKNRVACRISLIGESSIDMIITIRRRKILQHNLIARDISRSQSVTTMNTQKRKIYSIHGKCISMYITVIRNICDSPTCNRRSGNRMRRRAIN